MATEEHLAELKSQLRLTKRRQVDLEAAPTQSLQRQAAAQRRAQPTAAPATPGRRRRAPADAKGFGVPPHL